MKQIKTAAVALIALLALACMTHANPSVDVVNVDQTTVWIVGSHVSVNIATRNIPAGTPLVGTLYDTRSTKDGPEAAIQVFSIVAHGGRNTLATFALAQPDYMQVGGNGCYRLTVTATSRYWQVSDTTRKFSLAYSDKLRFISPNGIIEQRADGEYGDVWIAGQSKRATIMCDRLPNKEVMFALVNDVTGDVLQIPGKDQGTLEVMHDGLNTFGFKVPNVPLGHYRLRAFTKKNNAGGQQFDYSGAFVIQSASPTNVPSFTAPARGQAIPHGATVALRWVGEDLDPADQAGIDLGIWKADAVGNPVSFDHFIAGVSVTDGAYVWHVDVVPGNYVLVLAGVHFNSQVPIVVN